ncbi:MAG: hypothetical protein QXU98_03825 [Candidatus Parvarchaeota archaeon]
MVQIAYIPPILLFPQQHLGKLHAGIYLSSYVVAPIREVQVTFS